MSEDKDSAGADDLQGGVAEATDRPEDVSEPASNNKAHLDFATAIVLLGGCVFLFFRSWGYYVASGQLFYASPGFTPIIILTILTLLSLSLLAGSLMGSSPGQRINEIVDAVPKGLKSKRFQNSVIALLMFGVYIHVMLRFLPFEIASVLLLFFVFVYLEAASLLKCALFSVISVASVVLVFQVIFNVRLP